MSELEETLLYQILAAGLPAPATEFEIKSDYLFTRHRPPRRRRFFFDLSWDLYRVLVEVDGGTWSFGRHTRGAGYESDCEKANEAAERDWVVLRFTGAMVKDGRAVAQIDRVIRRKKARRSVWLRHTAEDAE
jgi:very-short-patch-repair endonuclease